MKPINNTLFIGKVFHYLEACTSTNDIALNMLPELKNTEGVVVCTFNQTAGRGQYGNQWISEPNCNIAISFILKPNFLTINEQFYLNKAVALAVSDFICQNIYPFGTEGVSIKWANDIFIRDKKVAGILIQNTLSRQHLEWSIIGIGINVNQQHFENLPFATSLYSETGNTFDLFNLVETICVAIEHRYLKLRHKKFETLDSEYLSKLYRFGEDAMYQYPNGIYFQGKIVDVSPHGKLMIDSKKGLELFDIKEVKFVI